MKMKVELGVAAAVLLAATPIMAQQPQQQALSPADQALIDAHNAADASRKVEWTSMMNSLAEKGQIINAMAERWEWAMNCIQDKIPGCAEWARTWESGTQNKNGEPKPAAGENR